MDCLCLRCGLCLGRCPVQRGGGLGELSSPRGRLSVASSFLDAGEGPSPRLLEELYACTLCRECELACPRELPISQCVVEMRKKVVLKGTVPQSVKHALLKAQRYGSPWGSERKDLPRESWGSREYLLFFGCLFGLSQSLQRIAHLAVELLKFMGVGFFTMGSDEPCCGYQVLSMGEEWLFGEIRSRTVRVLQEAGASKIVTLCPHCLSAFKDHYPGFTVRHIVELIHEGIGNLPSSASRSLDLSVALHDSCVLAREFGVVDEPREIIRFLGADLREFGRSGRKTECCGGGGGRMWFEYRRGTPPSDGRFEEARKLGADVLVTLCPYCYYMFRDSAAKLGYSGPEVMDMVELLYGCLLSGKEV